MTKGEGVQGKASRAAVIGWDVGGAHVKAARAEGGRIVAAVQVAAAVWRGLDRLEAGLDAALSALGRPGAAHAATMTAELSDVFPSRAEGVASVTRLLAERVAPAPLLVYGGRAGFLAPEAASGHADDIASANWHASAALVAARLADALLIDMGSTTVDVIPVRGGGLAAEGYSDAERLVSGELVYTGLTRTMLMAVADRVPFRGRPTPLMNEYFATTADMRRVLGDLAEDSDRHDTADGRGRSVPESIARLARMVGRDAAEATLEEWRGLAAALAEAQLRTIHDAALLVLSRAALPEAAPVVTAGIGRGVAGMVAARLGRRALSFDALLDAVPEARAAAAGAAPAAAVALLAAERG